MAKLKWVTEIVSLSGQDHPDLINRVSFLSAFRVTRFCLPVSGALKEVRVIDPNLWVIDRFDFPAGNGKFQNCSTQDSQIRRTPGSPTNHSPFKILSGSMCEESGHLGQDSG